MRRRTFEASLLSGSPRSLGGLELILSLPSVQHRRAQTMGLARASRRDAAHKETGHKAEEDGPHGLISQEGLYCMLPQAMLQGVKGVNSRQA